MKLTDIIDPSDTFDENLMIYQEDLDDYTSDIILAYGDEEDEGFKTQDGKTYYYLLELFLANEFVDEWKSEKRGNDKEVIAKALHACAISDEW